VRRQSTSSQIYILGGLEWSRLSPDEIFRLKKLVLARRLKSGDRIGQAKEDALTRAAHGILGREIFLIIIQRVGLIGLFYLTFFDTCVHPAGNVVFE